MATDTNNKNKLSRMDLFSMAIGQIIGVGIMTMTGIAIGFTGDAAFPSLTSWHVYLPSSLQFPRSSLAAQPTFWAANIPRSPFWVTRSWQAGTPM